MLPQRDDMLKLVRSRFLSVTVVLIAINTVAYICQSHLLSEEFQLRYLALSLWGLKQGYVWQLLTYQFMHGSWLHLLLNCWALFVFGRGVEWTIGVPRFLVLYFSAGIIGGLFQVAASLLWPVTFGGASVGASASIFGVVASFAMLFPDQRLLLLLFFVIPINLRAKSLLWLVLVITALGISFPNSHLALLVGAHVAHFAHLGGILTGLAFSRFYFLKILPPLEPLG